MERRKPTWKRGGVPRVMMSIWVPVETRQKIEELAEKLKTTLTEVVVRAVEELYEKEVGKSGGDEE